MTDSPTRAEQAYKMRQRAINYHVIATTLGYPSQEAAQDDVMRVLRRLMDPRFADREETP